MDKTTFVFVYGTLRQGFENHELLEGARFLGMAKTKGKYALYVHDFPYLLKHEPVSQIVGEVYEVNSATLGSLDELEEHPDRYKREYTQVLMNNGKECEAWVYFYPHKIGVLEKSGDYTRLKKNLSFLHNFY